MDKLEQLNDKINELNIQISKLAIENDCVYIAGTYIVDNKSNEYYTNFFTTDTALELDIYKSTAEWSAAGVTKLSEAEDETPGENDLIF